MKVRLPDNEIIDATCITLPVESDQSPLQHDFALLRLVTKAKANHSKVKLSAVTNAVSVGEEVIFSGYPLDAPFMLTHRGVISGFNEARTVISVQASINKGNSGGAVLAANGEVVGIITLREGGISRELEAAAHRISNRKTQIIFDGIDPLLPSKDIITTLNRYISTGVGYAFSTIFLRECILKHPELPQPD